MTEGVDDPAEPPPMLVGDRRELICPCAYRFPDDGIRVFHDEQCPASGALYCARAEALHPGRDWANPEGRIAHLELGHDVVALAHAMHDTCAKGSFIEGQCLAWTLDPQLWLDARHRCIFADYSRKQANVTDDPSRS